MTVYIPPGCRSKAYRIAVREADLNETIFVQTEEMKLLVEYEITRLDRTDLTVEVKEE